MQRRSLVAGIGAVAFGVLPLVAFMVANPPGGNYSASDIADFLAKGHRPAVFVSLYLVLISAVGLLFLLARLRESIGDGAREPIFWGFSIAAVAAWMAGYAVGIVPSIALAFSGGKLHSLSAPVAYTFSEAGWAIMYGAGGLLLGCALVTFAVGPVALPAWVRWSTLVAGIASLAAIAWFPFFLVYIWAIVIGVALVVIEWRKAPQTAAAQPA
jgi:hypothetical protein